MKQTTLTMAAREVATLYARVCERKGIQAESRRTRRGKELRISASPRERFILLSAARWLVGRVKPGRCERGGQNGSRFVLTGLVASPDAPSCVHRRIPPARDFGADGMCAERRYGMLAGGRGGGENLPILENRNQNLGYMARWTSTSGVEDGGAGRP